MRLANTIDQMVSEQISSSTMWFEADEDGERSGFWQLLDKTESHRNERDPEAVQVWDYMVEERL